MISGDPIEKTALAVRCPLPWCAARAGDRCVTADGHAYHTQRAMAGLKAEFPDVGLERNTRRSRNRRRRNATPSNERLHTGSFDLKGGHVA